MCLFVGYIDVYIYICECGKVTSKLDAESSVNDKVKQVAKCWLIDWNEMPTMFTKYTKI